MMKNAPIPRGAGHALIGALLLLSTSPAVGAANTSDARFATAAAQGGLGEVQSAQLALKKTTNPTVRGFAQHMLADHTANNAKLAAILRSEGLSVPASPDPNSRAMMTKLQALSGSAFDRAYMTAQLQAHGQMQILMQSEANTGQDARLRAYATTTLSAVNQHLAMARSDVAMLGSRSSMGNGSMGNGAMSNGSMMNGSMSNGSMSNGSMSNGTGANASGRTNGSSTNGTNGSGTNGTNGSSTTGTNGTNGTNGSSTNSSTVNGSASNGTAPGSTTGTTNASPAPATSPQPK